VRRKTHRINPDSKSWKIYWSCGSFNFSEKLFYWLD